MELLCFKRRKKRTKDPFWVRVANSFENNSEGEGFLANLVHHAIIAGLIGLSFLFTVVVIPVAERISRIKKVVTAPLRRGKTPPSDDTAP